MTCLAEQEDEHSLTGKLMASESRVDELEDLLAESSALIAMDAQRYLYTQAM